MGYVAILPKKISSDMLKKRLHKYSKLVFFSISFLVKPSKVQTIKFNTVMHLKTTFSTTSQRTKIIVEPILAETKGGEVILDSQILDNQSNLTHHNIL